MSPAPARLLDALGDAAPPAGGRLTAVRGLLAEASGLDVELGGLVEIEARGSFRSAEVVGFRGDSAQLMPLGDVRGVAPGCRVWPLARGSFVEAGEFLLGRVVGGMGEPIDGGAPLPPGERMPLYREPIPPLERPLLADPLDVGVRSINALLTLARGQRVGLFAGPGLGKSTLLGMIVRGTDADVRVVALVGERGREVREFIDHELADSRRSSVVVAVPSDASPLLRARAAYVATAIAEWFRDRGADVLLLVDSVTRFAMAAREIGLARSEPATTKGYTPSVFAALPGLLERAGRARTGSITGIYSVLVEGGDLQDPIADALLAILDGHVVLSRELAERGHFPAVDVLASVSRAMPVVAPEAQRQRALRLRRLLAAYRDAEDLIQVGAYAKGSDAVVDQAIARREAIDAFLCQAVREPAPLGACVSGMAAALGEEAA
jgi:flagellum-specific ATP synthase